MADQPETLPPFSGDEPTCPKCRNTGASTSYRGAMARSLWNGWNDRTEMRGPLPERLQRECQRCGFLWDEALATSTPAP